MGEQLHLETKEVRVGDNEATSAVGIESSQLDFDFDGCSRDSR